MPAEIPYFIGFTVASAVLVELIRRAALGRQTLLDVPNERSSHARATPRGGGIAIAALTLGGLATLPSPVPHTVILAWSGALVVALVSLRDDFSPISWSVRFVAHTTAAILAVAALSWNRFDTLAAHPFAAALCALAAVVWIVGLTNAYNFMDGIDGLAGGQAVLAGLGWALVGITINDPSVTLIGILISATSLGFLLHNWRSRIFMGDVGSTFLGFSFATLPLVAASQHPATFVAGALLIWPFLFDSSFTLLRRSRRRENLLEPHRTHLYQRLVATGLSHQIVSAVYLLLAAAAIPVALGVAGRSAGAAAAALPLVISGAVSVWWFTVRRERRQRRTNPETSTPG